MPELFAARDAFMQEHRHGGELDGGVDGERVWLACDCGAGTAQPIRPSQRRLPRRKNESVAHPTSDLSSPRPPGTGDAPFPSV